MSYIIKPRRGLQKDLPVLNEHELAFTTDTKKIYVGSSSGNQLLGGSDSYIEINYADLVALRDTSKLIPGAFYRITDYETTTVQAETRSAGHLFDIIVTALDEKTLSENASAIQKKKEPAPWFEHSNSDYPERFFYVDSVVIDGLTLYRWLSQEELNNDSSDSQYLLTEMRDVGIGDVVWGYQLIDDSHYENTSDYESENGIRTINNVGEGYMPDYFDGMRLEAWKLKYTLDNDRLKYYWADPVNGKGVIYRMIDEYENDLPYDFKNIQFKRYMITTFAKNTNLEGKYYALKDTNGYFSPYLVVIDEGDFIWAYTFTTKVDDDGSHVETTTLNKYIGINDESNTPYCTKNIFGNYHEFIYDDYSLDFDEYNSFHLGNNVIYSEIDLIDEENPMSLYLPNSNFIGTWFTNNTIGDVFRNNSIGDFFRDNTIGTWFTNNVIGNNFGNNIIGDYSSSNTIGNNFSSNTAEHSFRENTIGNEIGYNTIGNNFSSNTVGNAFYNNTIRNYFTNNTIGNYVQFIQFSLDGTINNQIRYLYLKNGLSGASSNNRLDLYYNGLYNRTYPTTFEIIANGNIVSSWEKTPLTRVGKVKATKTTSTWSDVTDTTAYFNYASRIYGDKYNLLASAWERSLVVNPSEISVDSTSTNRRGRAQYPNGLTEGVIIPQGITNIGKYAFGAWGANNQLLVIPQGVTSIGDYAFSNWQSNNQPLVIPSSVTILKSFAFSEWTSNNQPLVIPSSLTSIGWAVFNKWSSNTHPLVIPNSVTSIETYAFSSWTSNNQPLIIPDSVTSIGDEAFRDWTSNNQPLIIPDSVTSIGKRAFNGWSLVLYVEMKGTTPPTLADTNAFNSQGNAPIYVPDASVNDYKTATNWVDLADRIFSINDK